MDKHQRETIFSFEFPGSPPPKYERDKDKFKIHCSLNEIIIYQNSYISSTITNIKDAHELLSILKIIQTDVETFIEQQEDSP